MASSNMVEHKTDLIRRFPSTRQAMLMTDVLLDSAVTPLSGLHAEKRLTDESKSAF